jgi:ferredoxin
VPDRVAVDRVACTGHGVCAQLLEGAVVLDEWGYPVVLDDAPDPAAVRTAIALCPARALYRR